MNTHYELKVMTVLKEEDKRLFFFGFKLKEGQIKLLIKRRY